MSWLASELDTLPGEVEFTGISEKQKFENRVTSFPGGYEQRISYTDTGRLSLNCQCPLKKDTSIATFRDFWLDHYEIEPFKMTYDGATIYVRFEGSYSFSRRAPDLYQATFSVVEVHESEVIV
jgi:hypothetical protein